ncbi:MAG: hypothetical protein DIU68_003065 [Chloroflexota bacterium]|nr:MAG: hypothetical protein DIU68_18510 [Chloroflexota bacterium]
MAAFNPQKHLIQLKGKWYLETKYRIQWFREDHPRGCISTEVISFDPVIVKATVYDGEGAVLATAHAGAIDKGNAVWSGRGVEKSETAAIGRALAHAGYGTQFAGVKDTTSTPATSENRLDRAPTSVAPRRNGSASSDDLRDKDVASRFIQRWRAQALSDSEVLAALGVTKLSEWTKGRKAADEAVNAWLAGKVSEETA